MTEENKDQNLETTVDQSELNGMLDADRYRWLKANIDRWPKDYNAPHVRISEQYDYAESHNLDEQIDKSME